MAKTAAAASVAATTHAGKGVIAMPADGQGRGDQEIGDGREEEPDAGARGPQMTTLTIGIGRRLVAEHDDDEGQGLQCAYGEPHSVDAEGEDGRAEEQLADAHDDAGDRQIADLPGVRRGDGRTLSVVNDMPRKSPVIMIRTISKGVRIAWPVMSRPIARNSTCTIFLVIEFSV